MSALIKVGFCVAYDWRLLRISLPLVYDNADRIILTLDRDHVGWSGIPYPFNETEFSGLIKELDPSSKISIVRDNFHAEPSSSMNNEVRQRNIMAETMGPGGWHIQLDCDEYFVNFKAFVSMLKSLKIVKENLTNICCPFVTLFKQTGTGFLVISEDNREKPDFVPVAVKNPDYQYGRRNGYFNYHTNFMVIHQSWAHQPSMILNKLENWGHSDDFNGPEYFKLWDSVNETNYSEFRDFHPIHPSSWPDLKFIKADNIENLIEHYRVDPIRIASLDMVIKNSRVLSKIRSLLK